MINLNYENKNNRAYQLFVFWTGHFGLFVFNHIFKLVMAHIYILLCGNLLYRFSFREKLAKLHSWIY